MSEIPSAGGEILVAPGSRPAGEAPVTGRKSILRIAFERPWVRAVAPLCFVLIIGAVFNAQGTFYKWGTHRDMLRQVSVYGILACGMTLVIVTAGIDLAVGSILGVCAVIFSIFSIHLGWSAWAAIPIVVLVGATCGLLSGGMIARFGMQPFLDVRELRQKVPRPGHRTQRRLGAGGQRQHLVAQLRRAERLAGFAVAGGRHAP